MPSRTLIVATWQAIAAFALNAACGTSPGHVGGIDSDTGAVGGGVSSDKGASGNGSGAAPRVGETSGSRSGSGSGSSSGGSRNGAPSGSTAGSEPGVGSFADAGLSESVGASEMRSAAGFLHPGIINAEGGLDAIRAKLAAGDSDLAQALAALKQDIDDASLPACPSEDSAGRCYLPPMPATPASHVTVTCGSHSAAPPGDTSCDDEKANAMAAYSHALVWYLTQDESEAQKAISFLDAWNNVTSHVGYMTSDNSPLQCGWTGTLWARAAELIRYTYSQPQYAMGWSDAQAQAFGQMLTRAIRPYVNVDVTTSPNVQNGNWQASEADAFLQISVYDDNMADYKLAAQHALAAIKYYIYLKTDGTTPKAGNDVIECKKDGKSTHGCGKDDWWGVAKASGLLDGTAQETCRDLEHVQYGLGACTNAAETAALQKIAGVDLYGDTTVNYGPRLVAAFELHAGLLKGRSNYDTDSDGGNPDMSLIPAPSRAYTCDGENGFTKEETTSAPALIAPVDFGATRKSDYPVQPTWETAFNHFVNVENMAMPNTLALLAPTATFKGNRPTLASHPLAWETLTKLGTGNIGFP
jgi:hypothetical protein